MKHILIRYGLPTAGIILFLVAWAVVAEFLSSPFMPGLEQIGTAFQKNWLFSRITSDVIPSMNRLSLGFLLGAVLGSAVGALLGSWNLARMLLEGLVEFLRALPKVAIMPIFFILVGIGDESKVLIIATAAAIPMLLNTMDGFRAIEPTLIDTCKVYGLSPVKGNLMVRLRWASPFMFAGAKNALALAFIMMVVAEMYGSTNGVGYFILIAQQTFAIPDMWSGIVLLGILGAIFSGIFALVERSTLGWYRGLKAMEAS